MLMLKDVAKVLGVTETAVRRAMQELGNVGHKVHRQGIMFTSDDIDRIKTHLSK